MSPPPVAPRSIPVDISRIVKYAPAQLIGREDDTAILTDAWDKVVRGDSKRPHVLTFVALGGEGKTSLVAKWAAQLAHQDWPGCEAVFAWSFYSQGTREQQAASSDLFLKEALLFFGDDADKAFAVCSAGAFQKGQRLARIVGRQRSLLILDGLEPLQYAPTAPTPGELKDEGILALLRGLAATSGGMCIVTTRYSLPDLKAFWQITAQELKLLRLSRDAGVHLLKTLGVKGNAKEFATLVEDVKGHALTLSLLGGFLTRAFRGDIRQCDRVKFEKADEKMDGGHAFRTMAAYEQWLLRDGGDEGKREVAVLRLMGLFDRPADSGCLAALRCKTIRGLTEPLAKLAAEDWEFCLSGLEAAKLLMVNRDSSGSVISLDAHPHLRAYFAKQLREKKARAWHAGHKRLYDHLCATTKEGNQPMLEDLQPLYHAVAHGCQGGVIDQACTNVFIARILRGMGREGFYSTKTLGAVSSDLGAASCFFETSWDCISPLLSKPNQAFMRYCSGLFLSKLNRLPEAASLMQEATAWAVEHKVWRHAAVGCSDLSDIHLALGNLARAVSHAAQSVVYADRSNDDFGRLMQVITRAVYADMLHQLGQKAESKLHFKEAEALAKKHDPAHTFLCVNQGYRYCDMLLTDAERDAWQAILHCSQQDKDRNNIISYYNEDIIIVQRLLETNAEQVASCLEVLDRARVTINFAKHNNWLLDIALDHLTIGRAMLYVAILNKTDLQSGNTEIEEAVVGLRHAGTQDNIPRGLLSRAWLRALTGSRTGAESAQADLDEAWEIAERGPMRLYMADINLYRARLFFREQNYPWESPQHDLAEARRLIEKCGYWRRKEELEDAEKAILGDAKN